MAEVTVGVGIVLMALGAGFFFGTGSEHFTALIPAFFGVVFVLLGLLARKERYLKHAMHAAAMLGLIGCVAAAVMGLPRLIALMTGAEVARPLATIEQSIMALLCAIFVGLCVRSFVAARRRRASAALTREPIA